MGVFLASDCGRHNSATGLSHPSSLKHGWFHPSPRGWVMTWLVLWWRRVTCSPGPAVSLPAGDPGHWPCCWLCNLPEHEELLSHHLWVDGDLLPDFITPQDEIVTSVLSFLYTADRFKQASAGLPGRRKPNLLINLLAYKFYAQISLSIWTLGFCKSFPGHGLSGGSQCLWDSFLKLQFQWMWCLKF